jgi:serine/threonine protein kinase
VDDELRTLAGQSFEGEAGPSGARPRYRLEHPLGEGGTGVAFFALRTTEEGEAPHVVKVFRPALLLRAPEIAEVSRRKEGAAMRRLNEQVPPSPYIVRMVDGGELPVRYKDELLALPYVVSEYVNGGPEGTTLTERLSRAVEATGVGFDPERGLRTIRCIVEGLVAIHACGLIHRDVKPDNVLLCGFAETEVAKITDFGVARAQGLDATFGPQPIGTIGYAAPEQLGLLSAETTEATDVFALGVLLYRMLAADEYFRRIPFAQLAVRRDDGPDPRPHLRDAPRLHPDFRRAPHVVDVLDAAIRKATAVRPEARFSTARAFLEAVEPQLRQACDPASARGRRSATRQRLRTIMLQATGRTTWASRHRPGDDRVIRSVAWEPDGRALSASADGLDYWDGRAWFQVPTPSAVRPGSLQFALRTGNGRFLVGGAGGLLLELSEGGWAEVAPAGDPGLAFSRAAGSPETRLLLAGTLAGAAVLYVAEDRSWRTALIVPGAGAINGLAPLDDRRWVLVGRSQRGGAYLAIYDARTHTISPFASMGPRPLLAVASDLDDDGRGGVAYAVGAGGSVLAIRTVAESEHPQVDAGEAVADGGETIVEAESCGSSRDLGVVAIDPAGIGWAATGGRILKRFTVTGVPKWEIVHEFDWLVPLSSLLAAGGVLFAATVDGAILEGRDDRVPITPLAPPTRP